MTSVLQDWLAALPWKQQSILFSGLRGPDAPGCPAIKSVNRWMRTVTQHNADTSKDYMRRDALPSVEDLCDELEFMPVHYVHHFADALAVIAYGHPDFETSDIAAGFHYTIAEELFHFVPENADVFELRHRDKHDLIPITVRQQKDYEWQDHQAAAWASYRDSVRRRFGPSA